jgi:hypothetical protein
LNETTGEGFERRSLSSLMSLARYANYVEEEMQDFIDDSPPSTSPRNQRKAVGA